MGFWRDGQIIYADNKFVDGKGWFTTYYGVRDGYLRTAKVNGFDGCRKYKPDIVRWLKKFGYDYECFDDQFIKKSLLGPFVDKPIEEAEDHIKWLKNRLEERRTKSKRLLKVWKEIDEIFYGYVVGLDKEIDVYNSGFSVRVLLTTSHSFEERRAFVKAARKELVRWTMDQISESSKMMKAIGSLDFYKPVEIITLRIPEVEIKFQVKNAEVFGEEE